MHQRNAFAIRSIRYILLIIAVIALVVLHSPPPNDSQIQTILATYIVQGESVAGARIAVEAVAGTVSHELGIINAVGAELTLEQKTELAANPAIANIYADVVLGVAGSKVYSEFPAMIDADQLHDAGITGAGITVAVIDTGYSKKLNKDSTGQFRVVAQYDAIGDVLEVGHTDESGHGSHVSSIIANSTKNDGKFQGIAPDVNLVSIRAFDAQGAGGYLDVIRALDWVLANKDSYDIRVLNLSFSAPPQSYYWDDPLNQAVMQAWQAGIVVVAAAGNTGPDPMTIGVPGNVPYIITVGAMTDNYTPEVESDDLLASFSSTGPTVEGFVKPDIVAPGGHMLGILRADLEIATSYPQYIESSGYYRMSGTSQATAVTSGVVALMLQADPTLTPDAVKCRLIASARPALDEDDDLAYSIFQQGSGLVNALDAVNSSASGCANQGLDIASDLDGTMHYQGKADQDQEGNYYIVDESGLIWSGGTYWAGGLAWSGGTYWAGGLAWSGGTYWAGGLAWSGGTYWAGGLAWSNANMAVNQWVPQE